jgi:hypothetical protein
MGLPQAEPIQGELSGLLREPGQVSIPAEFAKKSAKNYAKQFAK